MSTKWEMLYNDTKERVTELVKAHEAPDPDDRVAFDEAKQEILRLLSELPGPNAHVDAKGSSEGRPVIFVGAGDSLQRFPESALPLPGSIREHELAGEPIGVEPSPLPEPPPNARAIEETRIAETADYQPERTAKFQSGKRTEIPVAESEETRARTVVSTRGKNDGADKDEDEKPAPIDKTKEDKRGRGRRH